MPFCILRLDCEAFDPARCGTVGTKRFCFGKGRQSPQAASEAGSECMNLLSAKDMIKWLDGEIERAEYPVGSLDINRDDLARVAAHAKQALAQVKKMQSYGR